MRFAGRHPFVPRQVTLAWPGLPPRVLIAGTGQVTDRLCVREIDDDEGRRLARIIRRDSGSVVTWRRAQMVLRQAQGMDVAAIAEVAFTKKQASMIRRYIIWRNNHTYDQRLRRIVDRANVA